MKMAWAQYKSAMATAPTIVRVKIFRDLCHCGTVVALIMGFLLL
jgi:hypothetical protein